MFVHAKEVYQSHYFYYNSKNFETNCLLKPFNDDWGLITYSRLGPNRAYTYTPQAHPKHFLTNFVFFPGNGGSPVIMA